jgi:hypothetical protein
MHRSIAPALVAALVIVAASARAEDSPATEAGHAVRDGTKATGHAFRDGTRAVGHATRDGVKATGHFLHEGVKATGHAVHKASSATGHAISEGAHETGPQGLQRDRPRDQRGRARDRPGDRSRRGRRLRERCSQGRRGRAQRALKTSDPFGVRPAGLTPALPRPCDDNARPTRSPMTLP